jgi:PadR family transcriptional regulator, regulatory protein PadR
MGSPRMTIQTLDVLSAMLADPYQEWYGLELANASGLKTGTIYPALARLEQAGWVSSYWEDVDPGAVGRPKRRLYRLTGEGADAARAAVDEQLQRLSAAQAPSGRLSLRPEGRTA